MTNLNMDKNWDTKPSGEHCEQEGTQRCRSLRHTEAAKFSSSESSAMQWPAHAENKLSWPTPLFSNDTGTSTLTSWNHLTRTKILLSNDRMISIVTNSCWTARCYSIYTAFWKVSLWHLQDYRHWCTDPVSKLLLLEVKWQNKTRDLSNSLWHHCDYSTQSIAVILFLLFLSSDPFGLSKWLCLCCFVSKTKIYLEKFLLTIRNWNKTYWREMPTREHILISYTWNTVS